MDSLSLQGGSVTQSVGENHMKFAGLILCIEIIRVLRIKL